MAITDKANEYREKLFPGAELKLGKTDPEFFELFENFGFDEAVNEAGHELDDTSRFLAIIAVCLGCQGMDEFKLMVGASMNFGVTPVQIKEVVYQSCAYMGMARMLPFLGAVNDILTTKGIELPIEQQGTTDLDDRLAAGIQAQVDIFGEGMREFHKSGEPGKEHINRWLTANCFGDYYTRKGLDYKQREMITFCFLLGQGGCEPQLTSHAVANMRIGNDRQFLINVVSQCLPYIGYPRSLNALRCIDAAVEKKD